MRRWLGEHRSNHDDMFATNTERFHYNLYLHTISVGGMSNNWAAHAWFKARRTGSGTRGHWVLRAGLAASMKGSEMQGLLRNKVDIAPRVRCILLARCICTIQLLHYFEGYRWEAERSAGGDYHHDKTLMAQSKTMSRRIDLSVTSRNVSRFLRVVPRITYCPD